MPDGETEQQGLRFPVQQNHAEDLVVDQALHERGGFRQNLVQIQRGVDLLGDLRQRPQDGFRDFRPDVGLHTIHFVQ